MKRFSSRLLSKAEKLQKIISKTLDAESDVAVMRSDRAADASMATGYSSRRRHRKHDRKTSFMGRITSGISRSTVNEHLRYVYRFS